MVASSLGWGWGWLKIGMREVFGVMEMCSTFVVTVVTQVYTFIKTHWPVQLKWMHFIVYKWYLNKVNLFETHQYQKNHSVCCGSVVEVIFYITNLSFLFLFSFVECLQIHVSPYKRDSCICWGCWALLENEFAFQKETFHTLDRFRWVNQENRSWLDT